MILNTGSRTDIPAYYSDWFYNRIKEGYVLVRNPYYPLQITKYFLNADIIDIMVFCTKNPLPMVDRISLLSPFDTFWFVTITPYGKGKMWMRTAACQKLCWKSPLAEN